MTARSISTLAYNAERIGEGWIRVAEFDSFRGFSDFVRNSNDDNHRQFGVHVMGKIKRACPDIRRHADSKVAKQRPITIFIDARVNQKLVSLVDATEGTVAIWSFDTSSNKMFRRTAGIVADSSNPELDADVIMTAVALGFAALYIGDTGNSIQFDMDPLEASTEPEKAKRFEEIVGKMGVAIDDYLKRNGTLSGEVKAGLSPGYSKGAVIMGVYELAGKEAPQFVSAPVLSEKGKALWEKIRTLSVAQYTGRGAYTGFVDNKNTEGDTDPVGPRSTARFRAPAPGTLNPDPHPRWLPPVNSLLWKNRKRADGNSNVPWGMIGGDSASKPRSETGCGAVNEADFTTISMRNAGMEFVDDVTSSDIAIYTHGMIQAIYKAYHLGPNCEPYEIAVGDVTKKMASCLTCSLFMNAVGYPPTSIHLGRGESWGPLYQPYNPNGSDGGHEVAVIRDLNNAWYAKCLEWLQVGLTILDDTHIADDHRASREAVSEYLNEHRADPTVGGVLILDAVTIHVSEGDRIDRTLK